LGEGYSKGAVNIATIVTIVIDLQLICIPGGSKLSASEATAASRLPESTRTVLLEALLQPFKQVWRMELKQVWRMELTE
jgi:hypothetical protein